MDKTPVDLIREHLAAGRSGTAHEIARALGLGGNKTRENLLDLVYSGHAKVTEVHATERGGSARRVYSGTPALHRVGDDSLVGLPTHKIAIASLCALEVAWFWVVQPEMRGRDVREAVTC